MHTKALVGKEAVVDIDDLHHIEQLALVRVETLHLDVENHRGIEDNACLVFDVAREALFVCLF